jgi:hypothetical protein
MQFLGGQMFKGKIYSVSWIDDYAEENGERFFSSRKAADRFYSELTNDFFGLAWMDVHQVNQELTPKQLLLAALNDTGWAVYGGTKALRDGAFHFKHRPTEEDK